MENTENSIVEDVDSTNTPAEDQEIDQEQGQQVEAEPTDEQKAEAEKQAEVERESKRQTAIDQRIAKLTWEKNEARREVEALREKYASQEQVALKEPDLYDFESVDDYAKAMASYQQKKSEQDFNSRFEQQRSDQLRQAQSMKLDTAETNFQKTHPDYLQTVGKLVSLSGGQLPEQLSEVVLELGDEAPAILYELGKDPMDYVELLSLPPAMQLMKLGEVRASLKNKPQVPKIPNAPAPVNPPLGKANVKKNPLDMKDGDAVSYLKSLRNKGK